MAGHMTLELYLADPTKILSSDSGAAASNYTLTDIQLHCEYISSPSLSQYFQVNPISFHVKNFSHRYQVLNSQNSVLRIPSAFSSLSGIVLSIRDESKVNGALTANSRQQSFVKYSDIAEIQFYSNNVPYWPEPLRYLTTELFAETCKFLPEIKHSSFMTDVLADKIQGQSVPIGISFESAPVRFRAALNSGIASKNHVSDLYAHVTYQSAGVTFTNYAATLFLENDSKIYFDPANNSLNIEY
jgi:hypothetical protein